MGIDNENLEMIELLLEFKAMKDIFYDAFHNSIKYAKFSCYT